MTTKKTKLESEGQAKPLSSLQAKPLSSPQGALPMQHEAPAHYIDIALVDLPTNDLLSGQDPEPGLIASVRDLGILEPILVIQEWDGTFRLEAGARRIKAARAAGKTTIPARVLDEAQIDEGMAALAENDHRSNNRFRELEAIHKLEAKFEAEGLEGEALCKRVCEVTHKKLQEYKKAKRLENLLPEIYESGRVGATRQSICDIIAHRSVDEQEQLLAVLREKGRIKHEDVQDVKRVSTTSSLSSSIPAAAFASDEPESGGGDEEEVSAAAEETLEYLVDRVFNRVQEELANPRKRQVFGMSRLEASAKMLEVASMLLPDHSGRGQRTAIRQIIKSLQGKTAQAVQQAAQARS